MRVIFALLAWIFAAHAVCAQPKLVHYGWDNPPIASLPVVLPKLKQSVFDGLVAYSADNDRVFSSKAFPDQSYQQDFAVLKILPKNALANSYLVMHATTDDTFDWSNEKHWAASLSNIRNLARLAKTGGFKGLVFDMEPYGKSPWFYHTQQAKNRLSFAAFQDLLQKRGKTAMDVMQTEFPGLDLWCLYGLSAHSYLLADPKSKSDPNALLVADGYGLWSSFFGGLISHAEKTTRVIDGNEPSYFYTDSAEFSKAQTTIRTDLQRFLKPDLQNIYERKIIVGQSVYVDGVMNQHNSPRFIGYYFKSDKDRLELLARNTAYALQTSESLVWIYSENNRWWDGAIRKDADKALRIAKSNTAKIAAIQPSVALRLAVQGLSERITISGKIRTSNGKGIKPESFGTPLNDMACSTWGDDGEYACQFAKGSDVIITPRAKGRTFEPKQKAMKNLDRSTFDENWVSK